MIQGSVTSWIDRSINLPTGVFFIMVALAGVGLFIAILRWLREIDVPAPLARFLAFLVGFATMLLIIYAFKTT